MNRYSIGLFALIAMVSINMNTAHAQNNDSPQDNKSATHMWLRAGDNMMYVPANSIKQCEILTRQAAKLNSTESDCYNREQLVKSIKCIKPVQKSNQPKCS